MQLYLRKKFLRSSRFFLTPLFLPLWGKLKSTRSNTRPCREAHSPSFVQSTPKSTVPPEQHNHTNRVRKDKTCSQWNEHKCPSSNRRVPESWMIWTLAAAPSCRSASSSRCRQVAVTPVSESAWLWLMDAENEKFPSPTSSMDREGDMSTANRDGGAGGGLPEIIKQPKTCSSFSGSERQMRKDGTVTVNLPHRRSKGLITICPYVVSVTVSAHRHGLNGVWGRIKLLILSSAPLRNMRRESHLETLAAVAVSHSYSSGMKQHARNVEVRSRAHKHAPVPWNPPPK